MIYKCKIEMDNYEYGIMPAPVSYADFEILIDAHSIIHAMKKLQSYTKTWGDINRCSLGEYTKLTIEAIGEVTRIDDKAN